MYVVIENLRIIRLLLQKEEADPYDFTFGPFHFSLVNSSDTDTCTYEVTRGTYAFQVMVLESIRRIFATQSRTLISLISCGKK
jgi:hypothetical protein